VLCLNKTGTNTVARGFIPVGPRSGTKTCQHGFYRHTACEQVATAAQPSGDKSPHHKDTVHIPMMCLCKAMDSLWLADLSVMQELPVARGFIPAGLRSSPKTCHHSFYRHTACEQLRLLRSRAGINPLATKILFTSRDVVCVEEKIPVASRFISHAGIPCGEGIYPRWAAKQPQKTATTVSTGPPRVSELRLLRSRAGINPLTTKILFTSP